MQPFIEYITDRLKNNGYRCKQQSAHDVFMSLDDKPIWICHLNAALEPEQIRRCFEYPGHVLFVVDEKLIPQEIVSRTETPMWLRVLHGLYMGRIYVWNGRYLFGLHFDYDTGDVSESGIIQPDELLLTETGTWLRGWPGTYRLARFYDRAWWQETGDSNYKAWQDQARERERTQKQQQDYYYGNGQSNARSEYEQARDRYQQAQRERERTQRSKYDSSGFWYDPADWPNGEPPKPPPYDTPWAKKEPAKRDFMREFAQAGSPSAVKALFRKLAREFHPDLTGRDTNEEMAAINAAYERWK